jgi:hypothetical protein
MIIKPRTTTDTGPVVYHAALGNTNRVFLSLNNISSADATIWNNTSPTSTVFTIGTSTMVNNVAGTYIAYLFASCPGISSVGSYTGTGTTLQINCGFTTGARFVLIKCSSVATGAIWYMWDSARGIVAANDPYISLISGAEVTTTDYIDPLATGFEISATAPASINGAGATFIYFAVA